MKTYTGHKTRMVPPYVVVKEGDTATALIERSIGKMSYKGFNWGYRGDGPARLAVSILIDATGCACEHREFMDKVIEELPGTWQMTEANVKTIALALRKKDGHEDTCPRHPLYRKTAGHAQRP